MAYTAPKDNMEEVKRLDYNKIIQLFTNKHTNEMYDRMVSTLNRVCRYSTDGFRISELPYIQRLIEFSVDHVRNGQLEFVAPLCAILPLCGLPFGLDRSNEDIRFKDVIQDLLGCISALLLEPNTNIQLEAADALTAFARAEGQPEDQRDQTAMMQQGTHSSENQWSDCRKPPRAFNHEQLFQAGVIGYIVHAVVAEVDEMFQFDVDGDGQISRSEMFAFKNANDGITDNDDEKYDAEKEAALEAAEEEGGTRMSKLPPYYLQSLMKLLLQLSYSPENAKEISRSQVGDQLIRVLSSVDNFREPIVHIIIEILWNLLEHNASELRKPNTASSKNDLLEKYRFSNSACKLETFECLSQLIRKVLVEGYKHNDKELRNEILIVASHLLTRTSNHKYAVATKLTHTLVLYATAYECGLETQADIRNFGTAESEDFQFKQIIWALLSSNLVKDKENGDVIRNSKIIPMLLYYLQPNNFHDGPKVLSFAPDQKRTLYLEAATSLFGLIKYCSKNFIEADGYAILVDFVEYLLNQSNPEDTSPKARKAWMASDGVDEELLCSILQLIAASCEIEGGQVALSNANAINLCLEIFLQKHRSNSSRRLALFVISRLCRSLDLGEASTMKTTPIDIQVFENNQVLLRRSKAVEAVIEELRLFTDPEANSFGESDVQMIVTILDFIWCVVVGNKKSEAKLFSIDGIDALLDLAEISPRVCKNQVYGILADLSRNKKSRHYFEIWRSDRTSQSVRNILAKDWLKEEVRLAIKHNPDGSLTNLRRPLEGTEDKEKATEKFAKSQWNDSSDDDINDNTQDNPEKNCEEFREDEVDMDIIEHQENGSGNDEERENSQRNQSQSPSKASERLRKALKASKIYQTVADSSPGARVRNAVRSLDLRSKIFAVLAGIEFNKEEHTELSYEERICILLSTQLKLFRKGALWQDIQEELKRQNIRPILADSIYMENALNAAMTIAKQIKENQDELIKARESTNVAHERKFVSMMASRKAHEAAKKLQFIKGAPPKREGPRQKRVGVKVNAFKEAGGKSPAAMFNNASDSDSSDY